MCATAPITIAAACASRSTSFHVTLEQGGTTFKDDDQTVTNATLIAGNVTTPFLGQTLSLSSLNQWYGIRGSSIYSRVLGTALPRPGSTSTASSSTAGRKSTSLYRGRHRRLPRSRLRSFSIPDRRTWAPRRHPAAYHRRSWFRAAPPPAPADSRMLDHRPLSPTPASPVLAEQSLLAPALAAPFHPYERSTIPVPRWNPATEVDVILDVLSNLPPRRLPLCLGRCQVPAANSGRPQPGRRPAEASRSDWPACTISLRRNYGELGFRRRVQQQRLFPHQPLQLPEGAHAVRLPGAESLAFEASFPVLDNENPASNYSLQFPEPRQRLFVLWAPAGGNG